MSTVDTPAASFKFNSFEEIRSHSSILYNERLAILFYMLDMRAIDMNTYKRIEDINQVRSIIKQIYKNIRSLLRNNPTMRATMNLDTKDAGIYTTDIAMASVDKMVEYCEMDQYTIRRVNIIVEELNKIEIMLKDVLQYFHYFIRPDFRQKPDIEIASEQYKEMADLKTVDELRQIVGKKHHIDFEDLGSSRIDFTPKIQYDKEVDGPAESEVYGNTEEPDSSEPTDDNTNTYSDDDDESNTDG